MKPPLSQWMCCCTDAVCTRLVLETQQSDTEPLCSEAEMLHSVPSSSGHSGMCRSYRDTCLTHSKSRAL